MAEFITVPELGDFMGKDLDVGQQRPHGAILDASAAIQSYTRQTLIEVIDDVIALEGTWGEELWLPERPVTAVSEVKQGGAVIATAAYSFTRRGRLLWGGNLLISDQAEAPWGPYGPGGFWGGPHVEITVKYTHGYEVLPDDIKLACKRIAARIYEHPTQSGQLAGEAIGTYSYRVNVADGRVVDLVESDVRLLNRYRPRMYAMKGG